MWPLACATPEPADGPVAAVPVAADWTLSAAEFAPGGRLPGDIACGEGQHATPPTLSWSEPPPGTAALALVAYDPHGRRGRRVLWLAYDIPASSRGPGDGTAGINDNNWTGFAGPCPTGGAHEVRFELYALAAPTHLARASSLAQLEPSLRGALARTELVASAE